MNVNDAMNKRKKL